MNFRFKKDNGSINKQFDACAEIEVEEGYDPKQSHLASIL